MGFLPEDEGVEGCRVEKSTPKGDREKKKKKKKGFGFGAKTERKVTFGRTEVSSLSKKPDFSVDVAVV